MHAARTVVYVEDNDENYALVERVLTRNEEFRVVRCAKHEGAVELIRRSAPAVILMDLDLPDGSGVEITRALKADPELTKIPVVALSACVMREERDEATRSGCVAFIEKPFRIEELRETLRGLAASP